MVCSSYTHLDGRNCGANIDDCSLVSRTHPFLVYQTHWPPQHLKTLFSLLTIFKQIWWYRVHHFRPYDESVMNKPPPNMGFISHITYQASPKSVNENIRIGRGHSRSYCRPKLLNEMLSIKLKLISLQYQLRKRNHVLIEWTLPLFFPRAHKSWKRIPNGRQTLTMWDTGIASYNINCAQNCTFWQVSYFPQILQKIIGILNVRRHLRYQRSQVMIYKFRNLFLGEQRPKPLVAQGTLAHATLVINKTWPLWVTKRSSYSHYRAQIRN